MGDYFSKTTTTDGVMDNQPVIAKARIVEHIVAKYEEVDNPETHVPYAKVPDEFCLKPKYEREGRFYYGIRIVTGSQKGCNATTKDVFFSLTGTKSQSERISLSLLQSLLAMNSFKKSTYDDIIIETDQDLGDIKIIGVGLRNSKISKLIDFVLNNHWYVEYVSIIDFQNKEAETQFQYACYHWFVYDDKEVTAVSTVATLKDIGDDPLLIDQRKQQIDQRRKQYTWKRYPDSGLPSSIDLGTISLPVDEEFHRAKAVNFLGNTFRGLVINGKLVNPTLKAIDDNIRKLLGVITHADFQTVNDLYIFEVFPLRLWKNEELNHKQSSEITKGFEMQICQGSRWVTDEEFGRQILNGVNPVMISRCSALPDNFPVTNDMVKNFLIRNMSLEEEMKNGHVYICDLSEIMDGLPCRDGCYCPAPICLLYVNGANKLVPIAIQLKKTPGPDNPIFLPSDYWLDWLLAKIYYRSADAQFHQLSSHYIACHAAMEAYGVATMRNLPDAHPLYKLLQPHFRYTIGINTAARLQLINKGGLLDHAFSIGGKGIDVLMQRVSKVYDVHGANIKENVKKRGVDDKDLLPNYHYRDDGLLIWDAIESYVREIIGIFYKSDEDVKDDAEVQSWANEVHLDAFPGYDGAPDGHGFPDKMESREDLILYCTLIMFNGSAQHAAVNFGQFDIYAFIPNAPFALRKPPPTEKGKTTFADILESLPTVQTAGISIGLAYALTQFSPDEIYLGGYPNYWIFQEAQDATTKFVKKMQDLDLQLKERNKKLEMPYIYLLPSMIPNSITI